MKPFTISFLLSILKIALYEKLAHNECEAYLVRARQERPLNKGTEFVNLLSRECNMTPEESLRFAREIVEDRPNRELMRDIIDLLECGIDEISSMNEGEGDHGLGGPRLLDSN